MSGQLYNLIMASVPSFYSGDQGEFTILKDRFLEYTEAAIKEQFQSLDQDTIKNLKNMPTIFAVEDEVADARIGKITDIKVNSNNLRVKYRFGKDYYPLTRGLLKEKKQKLDIDDFEFHRGHWAVKECDISEFYGEYLKSLTGIAHKLKNIDKKVQLIYAFNGTGKTRLSREFKELIAPKNSDDDEVELSRSKVLYYSAFTEDLFYWDNDLEHDREPKLKIQPNTFTDWVLRERGDTDIVKNFQRYTNHKLMPLFHEVDVIRAGKKTGDKTYPEVTFSFETGSESSGKLKISKGEERNFVWSIFYTLLQEVTSILSEPETAKRDDNQFDKLEYVFIDDPVSSLDDTHLIELAVDLANLIKRSHYHEGKGLKFVITTHSPLFYNVLHNELNNDLKNPVQDETPAYLYKRGQSEKYRLEKQADGTFELFTSNDHPFSYHLFLLSEVRKAIKNKQVSKYHFAFLRNILEKTATFLGYPRWEDLLEKTDEGLPNPFASRLMNISSHSAHAGEEITDIEQRDKEKLDELVNYLTNNYGFNKQEG